MKSINNQKTERPVMSITCPYGLWEIDHYEEYRMSSLRATKMAQLNASEYVSEVGVLQYNWIADATSLTTSTYNNSWNIYNPAIDIETSILTMSDTTGGSQQ